MLHEVVFTTFDDAVLMATIQHMDILNARVEASEEASEQANRNPTMHKIMLDVTERVVMRKEMQNISKFGISLPPIGEGKRYAVIGFTIGAEPWEEEIFGKRERSHL